MCPYLRAASPTSFRSVSAASFAAPKDTSSGASSSEEGGLRSAAGGPRFTPAAATAFRRRAIAPPSRRPPNPRPGSAPLPSAASPGGEAPPRGASTPARHAPPPPPQRPLTALPPRARRQTASGGLRCQRRRGQSRPPRDPAARLLPWGTGEGGTARPHPPPPSLFPYPRPPAPPPGARSGCGVRARRFPASVAARCSGDDLCLVAGQRRRQSGPAGAREVKPGRKQPGEGGGQGPARRCSFQLHT